MKSIIKILILVLSFQSVVAQTKKKLELLKKGPKIGNMNLFVQNLEELKALI